MFPYWPKHKSGIREGFQKRKVIRAAQLKWNALYTLTILQGLKEGDLWKQKRPRIFVSKIDREIKLKTSVLESSPELFPELKHPAGCSLQYLIMLAESLGGAEWYLPYINRHDEANVPASISDEQLDSLLQRFKNG